MESSYLTLCVVNAFLSSIASILNILTIYAIRKTPSLAKNLKVLLLSLAVSDLGIGLLAQSMYVAQLTMQWKYRKESYKAIYIALLIPMNIFITATLFSTSTSNSTSPQIPGTCDVQARYYCRNLNLGI